MANASTALSALSDPTRRRLFEKLADRSWSVGELAEGMPVTRSAVSQHLKVMKEAGLVTGQAAGTRRIYRLDPRGIGAMRDWLDQHWSRALAAFAALADEQAHSIRSEETPS